jgi:AAA family ATP:ADP antiporter
MSLSSLSESQPRSALERILSLVTPVHPGEGKRALVLTLNFFLLLAAYYTIKPVREGLILSSPGGAEIKSFAGAIQAVAFILLMPLYSAFAHRAAGRRILFFIYLFFSSNLLLFMALGRAGVPCLGIAFFLWMGIFNVVIVSQTWSVCADIYTHENGMRLFPLIAFGAASGAVVGSAMLPSIVGALGVFWPMAISAGLLVVCAFTMNAVTHNISSTRAPIGEKALAARFKTMTGGLGLVFSSRYLALIALMVLIANTVNTTSEYMLGRLVSTWALELVYAGKPGGAADEIIAIFYSRFHFWVGIAELGLQLFAVSRIIQRLGIRTALLVMPFLALASYLLVFIAPLLAVIRVVKIAENASDYSLNNTAREILFLPLAREQKYKAKLAVDTVFRRAGDALSGLAVYTMAAVGGLGITAFAGLNAALVLIWMYAVSRVAAHRKKLVDFSD